MAVASKAVQLVVVARWMVFLVATTFLSEKEVGLSFGMVVALVFLLLEVLMSSPYERRLSSPGCVRSVLYS